MHNTWGVFLCPIKIKVWNSAVQLCPISVCVTKVLKRKQHHSTLLNGNLYYDVQGVGERISTSGFNVVRQKGFQPLDSMSLDMIELNKQHREECWRKDAVAESASEVRVLNNVGVQAGQTNLINIPSESKKPNCKRRWVKYLIEIKLCLTLFKLLVNWISTTRSLQQ